MILRDVNDNPPIWNNNPGMALSFNEVQLSMCDYRYSTCFMWNTALIEEPTEVVGFTSLPRVLSATLHWTVIVVQPEAEEVDSGASASGASASLYRCIHTALVVLQSALLL